MNSLQLQADILPDGSLAVNPGGAVPILIVVSHSIETGKIAVITFGGYSQAVVTFDETGSRPINYTLYNPMPDMALESSVQRIVDHYATMHTLH